MSCRQTGQNDKIETKMMKKFPPIFSSTTDISEPCLVVDAVGNILCWYLPNILTSTRTVSNFCYSILKNLKKYVQYMILTDLQMLHSCIKVDATSNWRSGSRYYRSVPKTSVLNNCGAAYTVPRQASVLPHVKPGTVTLACPWYQMAHEVSLAVDIKITTDCSLEV